MATLIAVLGLLVLLGLGWGLVERNRLGSVARSSPRTDRERIFERFYRVDPARSRATAGTGLGMAIVKNIVHNQAGSVRVWSALEAGSTFMICLPRSHSDQPGCEAPVETDTGHAAGVAVSASATGPVSTWAAR